MLVSTNIHEAVKVTVEEKTLSTEDMGTFHYIVINVVDKNGYESQVKIFGTLTDPIALTTP